MEANLTVMRCVKSAWHALNDPRLTEVVMRMTKLCETVHVSGQAIGLDYKAVCCVKSATILNNTAQFVIVKLFRLTRY